MLPTSSKSAAGKASYQNGERTSGSSRYSTASAMAMTRGGCLRRRDKEEVVVVVLGVRHAFGGESVFLWGVLFFLFVLYYFVDWIFMRGNERDMMPWCMRACVCMCVCGCGSKVAFLTHFFMINGMDRLL